VLRIICATPKMPLTKEIIINDILKTLIMEAEYA
jgi:hypothetical protein